MIGLTDEEQIEKTISSKDIYNGSIIRVKLDEAILPDGKHRKREVVEHPGGAVVMPILPNGKILVIKQYRYPLGQVFYEFPAGKLDPGEDPLTSIKRELEEETGYVADCWEKLTHIYTSPGFCNERITVFKATSVHLSKNPRREDDEFIAVFEKTVDELRNMILTQTLTDAKSICAFCMVYPVAGK